MIERGDTHEIRNTGRGPLRTINVYVPPDYSMSARYPVLYMHDGQNLYRDEDASFPNVDMRNPTAEALWPSF